MQYQTGLTGRIQTFNFAANDQHLADQFYSSCVRQNKGYCCIQYQVCANILLSFNMTLLVLIFTKQLCSDPNSWTLNNVGADKGLVDAACATDYVQIESRFFNIIFDVQLFTKLMFNFHLTLQTPMLDAIWGMPERL